MMFPPHCVKTGQKCENCDLSYSTAPPRVKKTGTRPKRKGMRVGATQNTGRGGGTGPLGGDLHV